SAQWVAALRLLRGADGVFLRRQEWPEVSILRVPSSATPGVGDVSQQVVVGAGHRGIGVAAVAGSSHGNCRGRGMGADGSYRSARRFPIAGGAHRLRRRVAADLDPVASSSSCRTGGPGMSGDSVLTY